MTSKKARADQEVGGGRPSRNVKVTELLTNASQAQTVYEVYRRLENSGSGVDAPIEPVRYWVECIVFPFIVSVDCLSVCFSYVASDSR